MMTKTEFRAALRRQGFTVASFAEQFGVSPETVYRWGVSAAVPRWVVRVLALIDQHGQAHVLGPSFVVSPKSL